jgi:hypothetical protein
MGGQTLDLPRSDLLRSGENVGTQELVVSWIVKVCKGVMSRRIAPPSQRWIFGMVHYSVRRAARSLAAAGWMKRIKT